MEGSVFFDGKVVTGTLGQKTKNFRDFVETKLYVNLYCTDFNYVYI